MVLFLRGQRGGRLVENDDARLVVYGTRDLDHLFVRGAERRYQGRRIDLKVHPGQELLGLVVQLAQPVEELLVAEIDVLGDRHRRHQHGFLKHHGDAERQSLRRRREHERLTVEQHLAGGELVHAGERLGQRRLAGAVFADDGVDFAVLQREVDILDGGDAAEFLGRLAQLEDRAHVGRAPGGRSAAPESRTSTPGPFAATNKSARSSHHRGDAVNRAVGAAVVAEGRLHRGVTAHHETIGARRRPRLEDAHLLQSAALQRLLELAEARQGRRHPERLGHLLDHAQPVFLLAQNEFDQLIADREEGQPIAALRGRRDPSGISRWIGQRELGLACFGGVDQQHVVTPGFRHE